MEKATFPLFPGAEFPLQKREKDESFKVKQNERVVRHGNLGRSFAFFFKSPLAFGKIIEWIEGGNECERYDSF